MNIVTLVGRLGKDPEKYVSENGNTIVTLSIATTEGKKNNNGEYENFTMWHTVKVFGKQAENVVKYCDKGSMLGIVGSNRNYKVEKDGTINYRHEVLANKVEFLGSSNQEKQNN